MMQSENTAIIDNDNSNLEDISEELSGSTLAALQEFLAEKAEREDRLQMIASGNAHDVDFDEDWVSFYFPEKLPILNYNLYEKCASVILYRG